MNRKYLFLGIGAAALLAGVIVLLAFFSRPALENGPNEDLAKPGQTLSDGERAQITGEVELFISGFGNYGWYPDFIRNPSPDIDFATTEQLPHTTIEELRQLMRRLTNSMAHDDAVNIGPNLPYAVETALESQISIPGAPEARGSKTLVEVITPVKSSIAYVVPARGYMTSEGVTTDPPVLYLYEFVGTITLRFEQSQGRWQLFEWSDTVGILATSNFFIAEGSLETETIPTAREVITIQ